MNLICICYGFYTVVTVPKWRPPLATPWNCSAVRFPIWFKPGIFSITLSKEKTKQNKTKGIRTECEQRFVQSRCVYSISIAENSAIPAGAQLWRCVRIPRGGSIPFNCHQDESVRKNRRSSVFIERDEPWDVKHKKKSVKSLQTASRLSHKNNRKATKSSIFLVTTIRVERLRR